MRDQRGHFPVVSFVPRETTGYMLSSLRDGAFGGRDWLNQLGLGLVIDSVCFR